MPRSDRLVLRRCAGYDALTLQVRDEPARDRRRREDPVGGRAEAVPFVGEEDVFDRDAALAQSCHDLLGLDDRHVGVVRAVQNNRWRVTRSTRWIGERSRSNSASVSGSPYSTFEIAAIHGSVWAKNVAKLTTP